MGAFFDCFRGSNAEQNAQSNNIVTPDTETRRQAAAQAASRRQVQNESRGVDEDEYRKLKQRQSERERIEQQQGKLSNANDDGLRWQMN